VDTPTPKGFLKEEKKETSTNSGTGLISTLGYQHEIFESLAVKQRGKKKNEGKKDSCRHIVNLGVET